jgi:hypothetical protein
MAKNELLQGPWPAILSCKESLELQSQRRIATAMASAVVRVFFIG